ncbi:rhamnan synthesis F family protein [Amnibacterium flavum]|uniref:Rhamnan synthesis protein F n=1 Tax=Amnibacterium flavum TaxID=2173173 RepID=A0A2V1HTH7_9MICO|nr:rhamnan synthesis F family protein [Amnibacterium flavum]PVZ95868.1 hypothetical protein DDQ50_05230 [Amnibacterium flavum]
MTAAAPMFPSGGQRLVIYAMYDERGEVAEYVLHALAALRAHSAKVLVVANGTVTGEARAALSRVADEVLVRPNEGFDIAAQRAGLDHIGAALADYDEVVLTNDTWFGPVDSFDDLFERMDATPVHFWGITEHGEETPNPLTGTGVLPAHLQSYWIAARRDLHQSAEWSTYWRELGPLRLYNDAVLTHEIPFTGHFTRLGFTGVAAYPASAYPTPNASLFHADLLLRDGSPVLKRRPFFHGPWILDRHATIDRWTLDELERRGYPMGLVWSDLSRRVEPRVLNTNAAMLEVLPDVDVAYDASRPLRTLVTAHIYYPDMTDEILDRADTLPGDYDLVVTTPDAGRAAAIRGSLDARTARGSVEIRVVENDGRDQSAFLIGCRDLLTSGLYDIVVKVHSKKTVQDRFAIRRHFKHQQYTNLLGSPGYAANLVALFQREAGLGIVYPPMIHIGYPTLGKAWWANKQPVRRMNARLGISVPLDDVSPLAPFGSMYVARPEALRLLIQHPWKYSDFGGAESYRDGGLAHTLERVPSYAAAELGYHTRTVASGEYIAVSHSSLENLLGEFRLTLPGADDAERIEFVRASGHLGTGRLRDFARVYLRLNRPGTGARVRRVLRPIIKLRRWILERRREAAGRP